jgi:uncharacterized protein YbjT (DUF2867 family)
VSETRVGRVVIFGASGMVGQGVLRECLSAVDVSQLTAVVRAPLALTHPKFKQIVCSNVMNMTTLEAQIEGFGACFFCLGVSSAGMAESDYTRITYDVTLSVAKALRKQNPAMIFIYVSGAGTDSSERGRSMWARVKGRTENDLQKLGFARVCLFRPGVIQPLHGIRSKTRSYRLFYKVAGPLLSLARMLAPKSILTTQDIGRAMLNAVRRDVSGVLESAAIYQLARLPDAAVPIGASP